MSWLCEHPAADRNTWFVGCHTEVKLLAGSVSPVCVDRGTTGRNRAWAVAIQPFAATLARE
jgi:hypothetical protein